MPRPTNEQRKQRAELQAKQGVLDDLREMALEGARDAMSVMLEAVRAKPLQVVNEKSGKTELVWPTPNTERLRAAQYILDQVVGQPTKKDAKAESDADMQAVLSDIREFRKRALQSR